MVRGDADDGDNELACCGVIAVCSDIFDRCFGECISIDRVVLEPGGICNELSLFQTSTRFDMYQPKLI